MSEKSHITHTQADVDRFMRYVDVLPCGCWFWTGARSRGRGNRKWYGSFRVGRTTVRAHKFSAVVLGSGHTKGNHLGHIGSCAFSLCVNPAHIEDVTPEANQAEKVERRRAQKEQNQ